MIDVQGPAKRYGRMLYAAAVAGAGTWLLARRNA